MQKYPKIRRPDSNKDLTFYVIGYAIVILIAFLVVAFFTWLFTSLSLNYQNAVNNCIEMGHERAYCEYIAR